MKVHDEAHARSAAFATRPGDAFRFNGSHYLRTENNPGTSDAFVDAVNLITGEFASLCRGALIEPLDAEVVVRS